ncbi:MAG: hypothetical protein RIC55_33905 [Pirellulaceae bacterium]
MTMRISLATLAAVTLLAAASVSHAWQGPDAGPQGVLWGGPTGWAQSHFQFAPPTAFGELPGAWPGFARQQQEQQKQIQQFENDMSRWQPGLLTPSWWQTVGRPAPILGATRDDQEQPAPKMNASQDFAPPADGQPLPIAPQRVRSKVMQFNPQTGKLEEAKVIRW